MFKISCFSGAVVIGNMFVSNPFFSGKSKLSKAGSIPGCICSSEPIWFCKKEAHDFGSVLPSTQHPAFPHARSNADHMHLVGHDKVFSELQNDLKALEESGLTMADKAIVKGALYCIAGDNLGSHCIGGFMENFS